MTARLNVNIDHVATVRQARRAPEPSVVAAAMLCEQAGADGITVHLRGDRRHIQDEDIYALRRTVTTYLNVEMAATEEMIQIAADARPDAVTLVAERPDEITTEGGLDAVASFDAVCRTVDRLREAAALAAQYGLHVAAGHGLTYRNVAEVAAITEITEFNIGHNIVARAVLTGLAEAVREMRARIREAKA